jgi:hypothetical protein
MVDALEDAQYLVECLDEFYNQVVLSACLPGPLSAGDHGCLTPQGTTNEDKQAIEEELLAFRQGDGAWKQCEAIITATSDSRLQYSPSLSSRRL